MADYFNQYHLKHFAGTVAQCMEIDLPKEYAPGISWLSKILKTRLAALERPPAASVMLISTKEYKKTSMSFYT